MNHVSVSATDHKLEIVTLLAMDRQSESEMFTR